MIHRSLTFIRKEELLYSIFHITYQYFVFKRAKSTKCERVKEGFSRVNFGKIMPVYIRACHSKSMILKNMKLQFNRHGQSFSHMEDNRTSKPNDLSINTRSCIAQFGIVQRLYGL